MMNTTQNDMQVAKTILEQLGGHKFIAMTGASNFAGSKDSLSFKLPGNPGFVRDGWTHIKVTLTPMDVYTMTFYRIRGTKILKEMQLEDIYNDSLAAVIESRTGLRTRLF